MKKPVSIDENIDAAPKEAQEKLREIRMCLRDAAPGAEKSIKWGKPAFSYEWILFMFAAYKHHISFYPTPRAIEAFADELSEFKTSSSTIQFPLDQPLPLSFIHKIAIFRVRDSRENGIRWM